MWDGMDAKRRSPCRLHTFCASLSLPLFVPQEQKLKATFKVDGKAGNLGSAVAIQREGDKIVFEVNNTKCPKRYIKYLTKKYLKKHEMADILRPVAT